MPQRTSVGCKSYFGVAKQALAFSPTEWVLKDLKMAHFVLNIPLLTRKHQRKCKNITYFSINHTVVSALACSSANWEYWVFTQSRAFHQAIDWSIYTFKLLEFHISTTKVYKVGIYFKWSFTEGIFVPFCFTFIKGSTLSSVCRVECVTTVFFSLNVSLFFRHISCSLPSLT